MKFIRHFLLIWFIITGISFIGSALPLTLTLPSNASTTSLSTVTLEWREDPIDDPYTFQVATDNQFLNVIATGMGTSYNATTYRANISLSYKTKYYWHVRNATDSNYTGTWEFTTPEQIYPVGYLNVNVEDEQTLAPICVFNATIYNTSYSLSKPVGTCWANFSSSEIGYGEYLLHIVPNSSYASRYLLINSPSNVTGYLPATTGNTIYTPNFKISDYSGLYSWKTSILTISKNDTVMHKSYFDAEAKVSANLISMNSYNLQVQNGNNIYVWGNFVPVSSTDINLVILDMGYNATKYAPLQYNITWSTNNITLRWVSYYGTLNSLNYTIYKGLGKSQVYQLITSVQSGTSEYLVTNTSDIYYVDFYADTINGATTRNFVVDYRTGVSILGANYSLSFGTFTVPNWLPNIFAIIVLMILAGGFGAVHSGIGGIFTGIFAIIFWYIGWLSLTSAGASILAGISLIMILSFLKEREKT